MLYVMSESNITSIKKKTKNTDFPQQECQLK